MPLDTSGSKESVGNNIKAESVKPKKQAIAIALAVKRKSVAFEPKRPSLKQRFRDTMQKAAKGLR